jgi:hypothetical protein
VRHWVDGQAIRYCATIITESLSVNTRNRYA